MPVINLAGPQLSQEQKRDLVKSISEECSRIMDLPVEAMVVLIQEYQRDNVGFGSTLLSDRDQ